MQDLVDYARKNGIVLHKEGPCQFCGSNVSQGVFQCLNNVQHLAEVLDYNNPEHYLTRFLSVDALALQHCEIHGPWNNHIHLTRLFLILEKKVKWDYSKTPQLSNIINHYRKNRTEFLTPPPLTQRGKLTTSNLLTATTPHECMDIVKQWAINVYDSFNNHHALVSSIANIFISKYHS
jgi:hypothetical protein